MFNQWMIGLSCILLPLAGWALELSDKQKELKAIDQEIHELKTRESQIDVKTMEEDIESQKYMIANWKNYAEEVEQIHRKENEERKIELRIKELEKYKDKLLKQP